MSTLKKLFRKGAEEQSTPGHSQRVGDHVLFDLTTNNDRGIDIVFVHGLRGHPIETWSKDGVCWPRDLLKKDAQEASLEVRSITWGYDADIASISTEVSQESIFGHAETLLGDLSRLRKDKVSLSPKLSLLSDKTPVINNEQKWPIIFVGHSLGGLIIKQALIKSVSYLKHGRHSMRSEIYAHTKGVIFLGTPHRGSSQEGLGKVLLKLAIFRQSNEQLLRALRDDSHILEEQRDNFITISKDMPVVCFYEEIPIPGLGLVSIQNMDILSVS
jgi:protein SERAC1